MKTRKELLAMADVYIDYATDLVDRMADGRHDVVSTEAQAVAAWVSAHMQVAQAYIALAKENREGEQASRLSAAVEDLANAIRWKS